MFALTYLHLAYKVPNLVHFAKSKHEEILKEAVFWPFEKSAREESVLLKDE